MEDKITVFVMDSVKENEMYTCAKSMETEVIKLAGGVNVCENDSAEQWFYVSAETLIDKNPTSSSLTSMAPPLWRRRSRPSPPIRPWPTWTP